MTQHTPEQPLRAALSAALNGRSVAEFFAEDGVLELPFLASMNIPWRYEGRKAIADFYEAVRGLYPDFAFKPE